MKKEHTHGDGQITVRFRTRPIFFKGIKGEGEKYNLSPHQIAKACMLFPIILERLIKGEDLKPIFFGMQKKTILGMIRFMQDRLIKIIMIAKFDETEKDIVFFEMTESPRFLSKIKEKIKDIKKMEELNIKNIEEFQNEFGSKDKKKILRKELNELWKTMREASKIIQEMKEGENKNAKKTNK